MSEHIEKIVPKSRLSLVADVLCHVLRNVADASSVRRLRYGQVWQEGGWTVCQPVSVFVVGCGWQGWAMAAGVAGRRLLWRARPGCGAGVGDRLSSVFAEGDGRVGVHQLNCPVRYGDDCCQHYHGECCRIYPPETVNSV